MFEDGSHTSSNDSGQPDSPQQHSVDELIEKGIKNIVELCTKTIIIIDPERDKRIEKAVRGIIEAASKVPSQKLLDEAVLAGAKQLQSALLSSPKDSWYGTMSETIERLESGIND